MKAAVVSRVRNELGAHFAEPALHLHLVVCRLCNKHNPQGIQHALLHLQWQINDV